ncbi:hypothetical protein IEQ34_020628 [Dendrobium chrysotoxum]|uniref:SAM domain-containing protein n=1 Tax=Dendrobium chrysotoxum TaxID=161865 RepID=A0AAV7G0Z5_DENCH|nr:hypothetical protein IEQ34_020628 [Dendrobium chrysotoxum]
MDWSAWLSKSSLHPSLVHEYGLLLSDNELEEDDIKHLDHEFLLSMGISIGKHRLEILKLARKERKGIISAVKKLSKRVSNYVWMLTNSSSSAIVAVPKAARQWRVSTMTSDRKQLTEKQGRLMITNGNPAVHDYSNKGGRAYAEVRWDSMFQDLKPT